MRRSSRGKDDSSFSGQFRASSRKRVVVIVVIVFLEERIADDRLRRMLVPNVVLYIELLFAKLAAVRALEARRFAAVVLEVGGDGALRGVALPAARTRETSPGLSRAPRARVGRLLEPRQR